VLLTDTDATSDDRPDSLTQADRLGKALAATAEQSSPETFTALLERCNETIDTELGVDYGTVCDAGSDCC
jgi:hypothetical protein